MNRFDDCDRDDGKLLALSSLNTVGASGKGAVFVVPSGVAMRSTSLSLAFLVMISFLCGAVTAPRGAAAQGTPELLTQVQAADVLSDLITYTNTRADARLQNIQQYLRETGNEAAFQKSTPAGKNPLIPFSELFRAAVIFVQGDGSKYTDPSLKTLSDAQLSTELTELQVYNIQQFQKLNEKVKQASSIKAFLQSSGDLEKYRAWAKSKGFAPVKPPQTPEEAAARMEEMIKSAKETAWTKAQARGMSRAEFDKRWAEQVKNYQKSVEQNVMGCRALANSLTNPPPPPPAPPSNPPPVNVGPPPGMRGYSPSLPPPVASQYQSNDTASGFQARNDELWNRFDD
jgi:hypothetical protein